MKLTFAGVGSAFCGPDQWQTNAFFTNAQGKHLLIDCGGDARFSLKERGVKLADIDDVYITHQHADHVGGMEWLGFCTFFNPALMRPGLYANVNVMRALWEHSLSGGMDSIEGRVTHLTDFFKCCPLDDNDSFQWGDMHTDEDVDHNCFPRFIPVQTVHIMAGYKIVHSYGLMIDLKPEVTRSSIDDPPKIPQRIFFTGDTQFCPHQIRKFYDDADIIFQDCETVQACKSGVHAHYEDLKTLSPEFKAKMWLMHYQLSVDNLDELAKRDGFAGFVKKGQVFDFTEAPK